MKLLPLLALTGCMLPTTPGGITPPEWVEPFFNEAQCRLEQAGVELKGASSRDFFYIPHVPEAEDESGCGVYTYRGYFVYGNFEKPNFIHYAETCKRVLIHEFGHAILYKLGNPWHHCWEHWEWRDEKELEGCPVEYLRPKACP